MALSGYGAYQVIFSQLIPSTGMTLQLQFSFDDGGSWKSGASDYLYVIQSNTNLIGVARSEGASGIALTVGSMATTAGKPNKITLEITGPTAGGTGFMVGVESSASYHTGASVIQKDIASGSVASDYGVPTNVRLLCSTGNISGRYTVIGIPGL